MVQQDAKSGGTQAGLPRWTVWVALAVACASVVAFARIKSPLALVGVLPLLGCGLLSPQAVLIGALILTPFMMTLSGEPQDGATAAYSLSDVVLLAALPGVVLHALRRRALPSLGPMTLPVLLYLGLGTLSFALNLSAMHGQTLSYLFGFLRTVQIVLLLPVAFAVLEWEEREISTLLYGYLLGATLLGLYHFGAFLQRGGDPLWSIGLQKNAIGLALTCGLLIAMGGRCSGVRVFRYSGVQVFRYLASTKNTKQHEEAHETHEKPKPPPSLVRNERPGKGAGGLGEHLNTRIPEYLNTLLYCLLLACTLSRSSYVAFLAGAAVMALLQRHGRILGWAGAGLALALVCMTPLLPKKEANYVTNLNPNNPFSRGREVGYQLSWKRLQESPLVGDGFRARRDFQPHNLEMTLLAENGLIGMGLFGWVLWAQFRILWTGWKELVGRPVKRWLCLSLLACTVAILVHAQLDPYWRRGPLWLSWAGTGLVCSLLVRARRRDSGLEEET